MISSQQAHTAPKRDSERRTLLRSQLGLWIACGAILLLGAALRLGAWAGGTALHGDELALYLNLRRYDGLRLVCGRLDATPSTQAAPPLFLWAIDAALPRPGAAPTPADERRLRLVPLLSSLLGLGAIAWLALEAARRIAPAPAAPLLLFVLSAAAVDANLVEQAGRIKQYSGDVLAAALLAALWLRLKRGTSGVTMRAEIIRHLALAAASAALVWLSYPAAIVYLALVAVDLALQPYAHPAAALAGSNVNKSSAVVRSLLAVLPGLLFATASAAAVYFLSARPQRDPFLEHFWRGAFLDWRPWIWAWETPQTYTEVLRYALPPLGLALLIFQIVAAAWLWRRDRLLLAALAAPVLATILCSTLRVYPFSPTRVNLFLVPALLVLAGAGVAAALTTRRAGTRIAAAVLAGVIVAAASWETAAELGAPDPRLRRVGEALVKRAADDELVLTPTLSVREHMQVYHPALPLPVLLTEGAELPPEAAGALLRSQRAWLVVGAESERRDRGLTATLLAQLERQSGRRARREADVAGGAIFVLEREKGATTRPDQSPAK